MKNTDLTKFQSPPEVQKIMASFMVLIIAFIMISNSVLILGLYKTSVNLSLPSKILITLSCNDMLAGFSFMATGLFVETSCKAIHIMASISYTLIFNGIAIFSTLSILRFISLKKPFSRIHNHHVYALLLIELLLACGIGISFYIGLGSFDVESLPFMQFTLILMFFGSIVLVTLINLFSYRALYSHTMENGSRGTGGSKETSSVGISESDQLRNKRKRRAVITLLLISVSYFVLNLPLSIFYVYISLKTIEHREKMDLEPYVKALEIVNYFQYLALATTGTNSAIFIVRSNEIKSFYRSIIFKIFFELPSK